MIGGTKSVKLSFDSIIVTSLPQDVIRKLIRINVSHNSQNYSYQIDDFENNREKKLEIEKEFAISNNNVVNVTISFGDDEIISEEIDISQSTIGALKIHKELSLVLIFRVNAGNSYDIRIYGVQKVYMSQYKLIEQTGNGAAGFANVYTDSFNTKHVIKHFKAMINIETNSIREIIPFISLPRHPCLIQLEGYACDNINGISLVLEYGERGRISDIGIKDLDNNLICKMLYGMFSVISFLHEHGFIHRDIHPYNVVVTRDYKAKLIDFGVSRFISDDMTEEQGHRECFAPETINNKKYNELADEYQLGKMIEKLEVGSSWMIDILTNDDPKKRITCSEMCTLCESGLFGWTDTKEGEDYCSMLSKYHNSQPIRDEILWSMAMFYSRYKTIL